MIKQGILIVGKMGSGKTSAMEYIINNYIYQRVCMATWLKETVISHYGLEKIDKGQCINGKPMREILQQVGMFMRQVDANWHIDEVIRKIDNVGRFIIDDIRFPNEINELTNKYECVTIKIIADETNRVERICLRDGMVPTPEQMNHISETETDDIKCDYAIFNNGSLNDLYDQIKKVLSDVNT